MGLIGFTSPELSPQQIKKQLEDADDGVSDGTLSRSEFIAMVEQLLANVPLSQLSDALDSYSDYVTNKERRITAKWHHIANMIDTVCRICVPVLYVVSILFLFSLKFDDNYRPV